MKAYVSMISTDNFMPGALVVYESLKKTKPKFPFFLVITSSVSASCEKKLLKYGINVIRDDENILDSAMKYDENHRWSYTFDKIKIFKLIQFEKIVFLDSDMYINGNLDSLFDHPHFSAVQNRSGQEMLENKKYFNSGLMVIKPNIDEFHKIQKLISPIVKVYTQKSIPVGDQNVLNHYLVNWPEHEELRLPDSYNVFWGSIDDYIRKKGYSLYDNPRKELINVIHFTGKEKPWEHKARYYMKVVFRAIRFGKLPSFEVFKFLRSYYKILIETEQVNSKRNALVK